MTRPRLSPDRPRRTIAPDLERAIVRDYCNPALSWAAIRDRNRVSDFTINRVRLKHGLRRNCCNALPGTPRLLRAALEGQMAPVLDVPARSTRWRRPNPPNDARQQRAVARQLAQLERALASEPQPVIQWRRCLVCDGKEAANQPHRHTATAA